MKLPTVLMTIAFSCMPSIAAAQRGPVGRTVEDIYVVRSLRTSRVMPTDSALKAGRGSPPPPTRTDTRCTP